MEIKSKFSMKKLALYLLGITCFCYALSAYIMFSSGVNIFKNLKNEYGIDDTKTLSISSNIPNNTIFPNASASSNDSKQINSVAVDTTKDLSLQGIIEIDVDSSGASINIINQGENEIKAHLTGSISTIGNDEKPELQCYKSGSTAIIKLVTETSSVVGSYSSNIKLDVYIPSSYSKNLKLFSSAGDINLSGYKLKSLVCDLGAGKLNLDNINSEVFNYKNGAGDLTASKLTTKTTSLNSSSGSINLSDFTGDLKSTNSAGDTVITYAAFNNSVDIDSSAGRIQIKLPKTAQFSLDASTSFGNISCDFPVSVNGEKKENSLAGTVGSSKNKIKLRNAAGDIQISN